MYKLSARQILLIALISGVFAAGTVAVFDRVVNRLQPSTAALSEGAPPNITDPAVATDEQNNIEIYRSLSPGVVNIHSTSYSRDFFGFVEPQEGSGSGSIIDREGNILTNYHVIEGAQRLAVSLGGKKTYAARLVGGDPDTDLAVIRLVELPGEPVSSVDYSVPFGLATAA
jgi:putative serine protease PepD